MRRRFLVAGAIVVAVGALAAAGAGAAGYFWDRAHADQLAKGVTVAGVDVGGLQVADARIRVRQVLERRLEQPVQLAYRGHRFTLDPASAALRLEVTRMVDEALQASRSGGFLDRVVRDLRGTSLHTSVPLEASVSRARVATFVDHVARVLDRPAHDARVVPDPLGTSLRIVPSRTGVHVKQPQLERALSALLLRPDGARALTVPTRAALPHVWTSTLEHRYGTFILISRETFTLRLYKRLKLVRSYPIAVGRAGLETPAGFYRIDDKQVDPSWHVPLSAWAGALAGKVIPPGPDDPIKARWLGFYDGAGIHGTDDLASIGTAASHGCVRMSIPDVEELYNLVPLHTPLYVG